MNYAQFENNTERVATYSSIPSFETYLSYYLNEDDTGYYILVKRLMYRYPALINNNGQKGYAGQAFIVCDLENNLLFADAIYHSDGEREIKRFTFSKTVINWAKDIIARIEKGEKFLPYHPLKNKINDPEKIDDNKPKRACTKAIRIHKNDCWNVAVTLATQVPYKLVRADLERFIGKRGGMNERNYRPYLEKHGWRKLSHQELEDEFRRCGGRTINRILRNNPDGRELVIGTSGHVLFAEGNVYYDSWDHTRNRVTSIFVKEESDV